MIVTRSPLRISLGGGGTDLPSYYQAHEGFLIAGAINKFVYISLQETTEDEYIVKYDQLERTKKIDNIKHPIVRESLRYLKCHDQALEIISKSDIPAGTGLGSSGSFTTALLQALYTYKKKSVDAQALAEAACHVELRMLQEPVGKQDQFVAAFGGLNCYTFNKNGSVSVEPLLLSVETLQALESNLLLFYTGYSRSASSILREQDDRSKAGDAQMLDNLHFVKALGLQSKQALVSGDLNRFAELMNNHWQHKKMRAKNMSNDDLDAWHTLGLKNGAIGGKLIGAGGGGFLMFYAHDKLRLRSAMLKTGLSEVQFTFESSGTREVVSG